jgi:hypothetical protein
MISLIKSEWAEAKSTGSEFIFVLFWGFTFLAWGGLIAAGPLIVLSNLK